MSVSSPLLVDVLPRLANELHGLLEERKEHGLAAQVPMLRIVDRCRCGDDFCATFYTQPKPDFTQKRPEGAYGPGHKNILLLPKKGWLILDVVLDNIMCVEVLYRDEVRDDLRAILP
jgi:hypothetical protein